MKVQITHVGGAVEVWEAHSARYEATMDETPIPRASMIAVKRDVSIILHGATQVKEPER